MNTEIADFFREMPEVIPLYEAVEAAIRQNFENVSIKIHKTQISLYSKKTFASVWLPIRKIKNRPDVYIILSFYLDSRIESDRIVESVESYPNRWTHHIIIHDSKEVDDEIINWLR